MKVTWQAWRWFNSSGRPGGWSLDHAFPPGRKASLCGRAVPSHGKIFDCKSGTGQDRCKSCEKKLAEAAAQPPLFTAPA